MKKKTLLLAISATAATRLQQFKTPIITMATTLRHTYYIAFTIDTAHGYLQIISCLPILNNRNRGDGDAKSVYNPPDLHFFYTLRSHVFTLPTSHPTI